MDNPAAQTAIGPMMIVAIDQRDPHLGQGACSLGDRARGHCRESGIAEKLAGDRPWP